MKSLVVAISLLWVCPVAWAAPLIRYDTPYYTLYTDLSPADAREARLRMTRMAEEYRTRTRGFFAAPVQKLPFYLFSREADYLQAGGTTSSGGVFTGSKLLALAGAHADLRTWQIAQHEGFHQFAHAAVANRLPTWLDEGLAEYFGEGLFTGDGYVLGIIPPWRLARLRESMRADQLLPLDELMSLSKPQWNATLVQTHYDQAWSVVHFLLHGEGGRYEKPFNAFVAALAAGRSGQAAWRESFGDISDIEKQWRKYWLSLPDDPRPELYAQVTAATLAGFLGRAANQNQTFASFDAFRSAAAAGAVKISDEDWLPPSLLRQALELAARSGTWTLVTTEGKPQLRVTLNPQTHVTATATLKNGKFQRVTTEVVAPAASTRP